MEFLDLYTKERVKTGSAISRGTKVPEGMYRLVVHVCVFDKKGRMLIQQRQSSKADFAEVWDFTAGGSALSGDTSEFAVHRELFEEMGIDLDFSDKRPALTVHFKTGFNDIYLVEADVPIEALKLQKEEVKAAKYATLDEIKKMMEEGTFVPYGDGLVDLLFFMNGKTGVIKGLDG